MREGLGCRVFKVEGIGLSLRLPQQNPETSLQNPPESADTYGMNPKSKTRAHNTQAPNPQLIPNKPVNQNNTQNPKPKNRQQPPSPTRRAPDTHRSARDGQPVSSASLTFEGSFSVYGLGFRVQGSGFKFWGLGCRVWGLGLGD